MNVYENKNTILMKYFSVIGKGEELDVNKYKAGLLVNNLECRFVRNEILIKIS